MIRIHCYEKGDWTFPKYPINSYQGNNVECVIKELSELLLNNHSGISKIVIENDIFGIGKDTSSITDSQNIMKI